MLKIQLNIISPIISRLTNKAVTLLEWQEKSFFFVLLTICVVALPALINSSIRAINEEAWASLCAYNTGYFFCLVITFFKKIPFKIRAWTGVIIFFGLGTFNTFSVGPTGSGRVWLFTAAILATLILGIRPGVLILFAQLIVLMIFQNLLHRNLDEWSNLEEYTPQVWATTSITLMFLTIVCVVAMGRLIRGISILLKESKTKSSKLKRHRDNLGEIVNKRTTDLKLKNEQLQQAKEAAEAGTTAKSLFLANMSHEIRTPLNAVLGFLELALEDASLQEQQRNNLKTAKVSADSLLVLINDILDISKLERGKLDIELSPFSVIKLMTDIRTAMDIMAQEKGLNLELDVNLSMTGAFIGDPLRLRQILVNLVGNAIKFTEKGHVCMRAIISDKEDQIHFVIKDTGIGIPANRLDQIFKPFVQADTSTTRQFGGTGLGTTIARELVELMGGRIWVESEEGKGSTFHFTIHLPPADQVQDGSCEKVCSDREVGQHFRRDLKILIVEDVEANSDLARIRLEQHSHQVTVARNGREALELFKSSEVDLILMDIQMPVMGGLEATERIRVMEAGTGNHVPIIAMTAAVMKEESEKYMEAGMDAVVGKPVDFKELYKMIETVVPENIGKSEPKTGIHQERILVVDDDRGNLQSIKQILEEQYQLYFAINSKKALDIGTKVEPDIILLAAMMPEMDGYQIYEQLKDNPETADTPVILMTTGSEKRKFQMSLESGIVNIIEKPIDASEIRKKLRQHLLLLTR